MRQRDPARRRRRALDLLLSRGCQTRAPSPPPRDAVEDEAQMSEQIAPPGRLLDRALDRFRGRYRLHRRYRTAGRSGRRRRSRGRCRGPASGRDRTARRRPAGDRGDAHRGQRLRARGGRRSDAVGARSEAAATRRRAASCRSSRRRSSTTSPSDDPAGAARPRGEAMRPAKRPRRGSRSEGGSGPGPGPRSGRSLGRGAPTPKPGSATPRRGPGVGHTVAALAVANAFGDLIGADGEVLAGHRARMASRASRPRRRSRRCGPPPDWTRTSRSTTRRSSACSPTLRSTRPSCSRVARMASAGVTTGIDPVVLRGRRRCRLLSRARGAPATADRFVGPSRSDRSPRR